MTNQRPTEALRYAVDQHLHDRAHNASDTDKCRASAREVLTEYDALDATIDSLTAEVGRLRGLLGEAYEHLTTPTDVARFTPGEMMSLTDRIDAALTPPADQLIDRAKRVEMTPEERESQRRSFAYGNAAIDNPNVTRKMVDAAADAMPADHPAPATEAWLKQKADAEDQCASVAAGGDADQPDLTKCPECNGPADQGFSRDVPPQPYSCSKCAPEQPAPATKKNRCDVCPLCGGFRTIRARVTTTIGTRQPLMLQACTCTGRVPATEDENAVSGEGGG